jgi:hypothetical protein
MSKIKKPHEISTHANIKGLVYGQPGVGKTTFALSAPNPVLLDFDNGVHRVNAEHQTDTLQISSWQDVLDELNAGTFHPYQTIVVDTAGKMLDYLAEYLIQQNPKLGKRNGALSLQGYGERKGEFISFLKKLSIMGKHIIFVAHEKEEKEGDVSYRRPEVGGSSGNDLYKELDLIGYMEMIGNKRTISFMPTEKYYAKNACGLNSVIELPALNEGQQNNLFTQVVVDTYKHTLDTRKEKVTAYNELIELIEEKVNSISSPAEANEVLVFLNEFPDHVWSSKLQGKQLLNAKVKELAYEFDKVKSVFLSPKKVKKNEPVEAEV